MSLAFRSMPAILVVLLAFFLLEACQGKEKENKEQVLRGKKLFKTYCVLCHGENADGKGRLAVGKIPPPANLTEVPTGACLGWKYFPAATPQDIKAKTTSR